MKKNPETTALTRETLTQSFWSLYCRKKIDHISVKEITDRAGYHRSTFYEYFVDIYDVLNQLEDSLIAHLKEIVLNSEGVEQSDDIVQILADFYESMGKYLSVLLGQNGDPSFANKLKAVMRPILLKRLGLPETDIHTSYFLEFGMSASLATIMHWYQNKKNLPSKELIFLLRSMLVNGVFSEVHKYSNLPADSLR